MIDNPLSSNEALKASGSIIKSDRENLVDAEKKIAELELKLRNATVQIDRLKWLSSERLIGVTALAKHFNCPPDEYQKIYKAYCDEQEKEYAKMTEEAKKKILADIRSGMDPQFIVVNEDAAKENPVKLPFKLIQGEQP